MAASVLLSSVSEGCLPKAGWIVGLVGIAMTYVDAALSVLRAARRPMTVEEITETAIRKGLISPKGKTPVASMSAALYVHVREVGDTPIRRVFEPGGFRAVRGSVRWVYGK